MSFKPKDTHERVVHRLKIARGQLNKVLKMTDEEANYIDIIHQSQAVQGALRETNRMILLNQLDKYKENNNLSKKGGKSINELVALLLILNKI